MGIDRLEKVIARIRQFDPQSVTQQYDIPLVDQLSAATDDALVRTFGPETIEYERYSRAARFDNGPHNYAYRVPIEEVWQSLARSKATNIALLEQAVGSLKERLAEEEALSQPEDPDFALWSEPTLEPRERSDRKIFIVHGHAEGPRETVARFLQRAGLAAIRHQHVNF
jgi:hypothetical protein